MSRCDVIIPVKDSPWWVEWCLRELLRNTDPDELGAVVVVDDGSSAASHEVLRSICERHSGVRLELNRGRPGFGGACNYGVSLTSSPQFLLLNTDCLVTPRLVKKLVSVAAADPSVGLVCPLSNNSPVLTLPLSPGRSYLEMNRLLETATTGAPVSSLAPDACTVVGNCLLITRSCWEATGEFDALWGAGYGEETDFQFRAMERGFRGVALTNAYVFHMGSASFRFQQDIDKLKARALGLFHSKWGTAYQAYSRRCEATDPVGLARRHLASHPDPPVDLDVLFILPGIAQGVGGIHVAVDVCNHLVRQGLRAACAVLGELDPATLASYQEPILQGLLHFPGEEDLLNKQGLSARIVVATLFSTVRPAHDFSRIHGARLVHFVQGYEFYFENGLRWAEVEDAFLAADEFVATSRWLEDGIRRHTPGCRITRLPPGVNRDVFFVGSEQPRAPGKVTLALVLRSSQDKGQWILQEVLHRLSSYREQFTVVLLRAAQYAALPCWLRAMDLQEIELPTSRESVAAALRSCDVLVDASLHEGFGLLPLEAMACGATVVVSASGGVEDFVEDGRNGLVVRESVNPARYVEAVRRLVDEPGLLSRLRQGAMQTAEAYEERTSLDAYTEYFHERLAHAAPRSEQQVLLQTGEGLDYPGITTSHQVIVAARPGLHLSADGDDPALLLPALTSESDMVLRIEMTSARESVAQVFVPEPSKNWLDRTRRATGKLLRSALSDRGGLAAEGPYRENDSAAQPVTPGSNILLYGLPRLRDGGRIRFDPLSGSGDVVLSSLEVRAVDGVAGWAGNRLQAAFEASSRTLLRLDDQSGFGRVEPLRHLTVSRIGRGLRSLGTDPQLILRRVEPDGCPVCIEIEMDSPTATALQLYYELAGQPGFSEALSVRRRLTTGRNYHRVVLSHPRLTGAFRLDIGMVAGEYHLWRLDVRRLA